MLLKFQANVYALPSSAVEGSVRSLRGLDLPSLTGESGGPPLFLEVLPVTFEAMQQQLFELPRCDCEPDGFFLVTGRTEDGTFWRLNGHMHEYQPDGADEPLMHRCELSGECPEGSLDTVLRTMGWPAAELVFQLVKEGVTLREEAFRLWARVDTTRLAKEASSSGLSNETEAIPTESKNDPALQQSQSEATPNASRVVSTRPPELTPWHLTWGTYGTRLHGGPKPTVDRQRNHVGESFEPREEERRQAMAERMAGDAVRLSQPQRECIESLLPSLCERGKWQLHAVAAQSDHVHVVCSVPFEVHGEQVQSWLKRWLTEALNEQWPGPDRVRWWAKSGSNKAIREEEYLQNAIAYVERQRTNR